MWWSKSRGSQPTVFNTRCFCFIYIYLAVDKGHKDLSVQLLRCKRWSIETGATGLKMTNVSISSRLDVLCVWTKPSSWSATTIQTCTQWSLSCFRGWSLSDQGSISFQITAELGVWVGFKWIKEAELCKWSTGHGTRGAFRRVRIGNCNRERQRVSIMSYVTSEWTGITAALECRRLIALVGV